MDNNQCANPAFYFKRFSLEDVDDVLRLENLAYPDPWKRSMFYQELKNLASCFYVMFAAEDLVGYGGFWVLLDEIHITKVTISEAYRNRGYGRSLVEFLLKEGRSVGAETVRLEVRESNQAARTLYQHMGFEQIGYRKNYYSITSESAIVMGRQLLYLPECEG